MKSLQIRYIIKKLEMVLENQLTREEVSDWAYAHMMTLENKETTRYEELVFDCLTVVYGMDLPNDSSEYLHCEEDIRDWIKRFEKIESRYQQNKK